MEYPRTALDHYHPADNRYQASTYRRLKNSGLHLPPVSLGLWHNFGDDKPLLTQRQIIRRAFDLGMTHFDLANNYGPPPGSAEKNFGRIYEEDLKPFRDELIISTKAGWDMWPGPPNRLRRNYASTTSSGSEWQSPLRWDLFLLPR